MSQPRGTIRKSLYERFKAKVKFAGPNECWVWQASIGNKGYGRLFGGIEAPDEQLAHRISWILYMGPIPEGFSVLHHCDNPPCVNPLHLFLGTNKDNVNDMLAKSRRHSSKGEANPAAMVTEDIVREIRRIYAEGGITQTALGARFDVSQHIVSRIVTRDTWNHVL